MPADAFRGIGPAQYDNAIITPPVPREQSARTNPGGYGRRFSVVASTPAIGWVWQDSSRAAKVIGVGIVRKWNHSSAANRTFSVGNALRGVPGRGSGARRSGETPPPNPTRDAAAATIREGTLGGRPLAGRESLGGTGGASGTRRATRPRRRDARKRVS